MSARGKGSVAKKKVESPKVEAPKEPKKDVLKIVSFPCTRYHKDHGAVRFESEAELKAALLAGGEWSKSYECLSDQSESALKPRKFKDVRLKKGA